MAAHTPRNLRPLPGTGRSHGTRTAVVAFGGGGGQSRTGQRCAAPGAPACTRAARGPSQDARAVGILRAFVDTGRGYGAIGVACICLGRPSPGTAGPPLEGHFLRVMDCPGGVSWRSGGVVARKNFARGLRGRLAAMTVVESPKLRNSGARAVLKYRARHGEKARWEP